MPPISSSSPNDDLTARADIAAIAQKYHDEGYEVVLEPGPDRLPLFLDGFRPDMIATRGLAGIVVEVMTNRLELSEDPRLASLAEVVEAQAGWSLDIIILEREDPIEKAARGATEPSDDQLAQILRSADDLANSGYVPHAYVIA